MIRPAEGTISPRASLIQNALDMQVETINDLPEDEAVTICHTTTSDIVMRLSQMRSDLDRTISALSQISVLCQYGIAELARLSETRS